MQSAQEFMREFFEELLAFEQAEEVRRLDFHRRFYAADCHWGKNLGRVWRAKSLKVLSVTSIGSEAEVIASRLAADEPDICCEIRYRLKSDGQGWLICGVDLRCCCDGEG